jgi:hypothetical protein
MTIILQDLLDHVVSHVQTTGHFDRVNQHEPKNAPGNGVSCAVWVDDITPVKSGLASTTVRITFNVRLYASMLQEPQDDIDPNLTNALSALFDEYSGDFTFDGNVQCIDLLGKEGIPLSAKAGYLNQDSKLFRVYTVTLPVIVNDVWTQAP